MSVIKATLTEPFVGAAMQILQGDFGVSVTTGAAAEGLTAPTGEVIVMVGVTGRLSGVMALVMARETACGVAGTMMGETVTELDAMAKSAVAELGNMVAGRATVNLEQLGLSANITPPSVLTGRETEIETLDTPRAMVALQTSLGVVRLHLSLREVAA